MSLLGSVSVVFKIYRVMALLKVFESQLLTETFRGSAQARPKQALHDTSNIIIELVDSISRDGTDTPYM